MSLCASRADNGVYSGRKWNLMNDGIKESDKEGQRERDRKKERTRGSQKAHTQSLMKKKSDKKRHVYIRCPGIRRSATIPFFPLSFFQSQFMSRGKYFNLFFFWREMGTVDLYTSPFEGNVGKNFHANVPFRHTTEW